MLAERARALESGQQEAVGAVMRGRLNRRDRLPEGRVDVEEE